MSEIGEINPKRPKYLIKHDARNVKIKITEDEKKTFTIAEHNAKLVGLEHSNIPDILSKTFELTVMAQIFEPIDNAIICVDEFGNKINTNKGDYECAACNEFNSESTEKYPHGHCKFAVQRWIEKFGSLDSRPEGLDDLQRKLRKIGEEKQVELTPEEVMQLTEGIPDEFTEEIRSQINDDDDKQSSIS